MGSDWTILVLLMSMLYCSLSPSEISLLVTEPKRRPPWPALATIFTGQSLSRPDSSTAAARSSASRARRALSCIFMVLMFSALASTASLRGSRKLRAYPSETSTIWPFLPCPFTSCCKITFMMCSS